MTKPGADQSHSQHWKKKSLSKPRATAMQSESRAPQSRRNQHQQSALFHQNRRQRNKSCHPGLPPATTMLRIQPDVQTPERQGHNGRERHLEHIIRSQIQQCRRQSDQEAGNQSHAIALQTPAPTRCRHKQQPMPEAETPSGLSGIIPADRHHAAIHQ